MTAMANDLIHDRGRGPELVGTRITVYNLLPDFLDPAATEDHICRMYQLTPEQVSAARAYVFSHADTVLARHLDIEARMAAGNPPEVIEQAKQTHATLLRFKQWLAQREEAAAQGPSANVPAGGGGANSEAFPTFREWLADQSSRPAEQP
jgi:uncharacterized protein (DUF433 family)